MKYAGLERQQKLHDIRAWLLKEAELAATTEALLRGGKVKPASMTRHVIDAAKERAEKHPEDKELLDQELPKFLLTIMSALENIRQKRQAQ